jgi:hypothetical protein
VSSIMAPRSYSSSSAPRSMPLSPYHFLYTGSGTTHQLFTPSRDLLNRYSSKLDNLSPPNTPLHFPDQPAIIMETVLRWLREWHVSKIQTKPRTLTRHRKLRGYTPQEIEHPSDTRHLSDISTCSLTSSQNIPSTGSIRNDNEPPPSWIVLARVWVLADDLGLTCIQDRVVDEVRQKLTWLLDEPPNIDGPGSPDMKKTTFLPIPGPSPTPSPRKRRRSTTTAPASTSESPTKRPRTTCRGIIDNEQSVTPVPEPLGRLDAFSLATSARFNPARPRRHLRIAPATLHYVYNATAAGARLRDLFADVVACATSPDLLTESWEAWPRELGRDVAVAGMLRDGAAAGDWLRRMFERGAYFVAGEE